MAISEYYMLPPMPEGLEDLAELGLDLLWSWSHKSDILWEQLDGEIWKLTRNPWLILQSVSWSRLNELAKDSTFRQNLQEQVEQHNKYLNEETWFSRTHKDISVTIAYLSMEFGLSESLPIYSGGLGILAGDVLKTASDLGVPVVGVGLLYQQGYFRQVINSDGKQIEYYPYNDPSQLPVLPVRDKDGQWLYIKIQFPGRLVHLRAWEARVGRVKLYLLDSNVPENGPADQCITAELYGGNPEIRLQQEMILGIGGWRLLHTLGINAQVCHLNEGHAALAVLERARIFAEEENLPFEVALEATKGGNVFTTHTSVVAGFDRFAPSLVYQHLKRYSEQLKIEMEDLLNMGREKPGDSSEPLNMAYLAVRGSGIINAVSRLHCHVSHGIFQNLFPGWPRQEVPITYITNGVHMPSWDSKAADKLWTETCGKDRWIGSLEAVEENLKKVSDETLWKFRNEGRGHLVEYVRKRLARQLEASGASDEKIEQAKKYFDPNVFTIGFARRFTAYKRPNLLLHDKNRLKALLLNKERPIQMIIAGKAHPRDEQGKSLIASWSDFLRQGDVQSHVIFLADYDMSLAEHLVQGVDLWLNTPRRPWEACGTSGMKVLVNGGINFSELDGWWAEAYRPDLGWSLGDRCEHPDYQEFDACEAEQLYKTLENDIVPAFYKRGSDGIPTEWILKMKKSMAELTPYFSSNRMLREYIEKLYLPASDSFTKRSSNKAEKSITLLNLKKTLKENFYKINFRDLEFTTKNDQYYCRVPVLFDGINPDSVAVQLYAELHDGEKPEIYNMIRTEQASHDKKLYYYNVQLPARRKVSDYTLRIIPLFDGIVNPMESGQILWKNK